MNQNLAWGLGGVVSGVVVGACAGYYSGARKVRNSPEVTSLITMAHLNADVIKWIAEEAPVLEWDDFVNKFTEKLDYMELVARTLQDNFSKGK